MSTWFVVVTFHPEKKALAALRKVLDGWPAVEIDNSSKNLGYGGGANVGMRGAFSQGADWVVILNQDIAMTKEAVRELCTKLKQLPPGIAGPFSGSLDPKRWTTILPARGKTIDYISGACIAIHRTVIELVGYFYEPYFMYYEDVDLCVRAKRAEFQLTQIPILGIRHTETTSLGKGSYLHQYYLARNHLLFVERNAPLAVRVREILRLPKTLWEHYHRGEQGAKTGIKDYVFRKFGAIRKL